MERISQKTRSHPRKGSHESQDAGWCDQAGYALWRSDRAPSADIFRRRKTRFGKVKAVAKKTKAAAEPTEAEAKGEKTEKLALSAETIPR